MMELRIKFTGLMLGKIILDKFLAELFIPFYSFYNHSVFKVLNLALFVSVLFMFTFQGFQCHCFLSIFVQS